jgi:hypothetical protein
MGPIGFAPMLACGCTLPAFVRWRENIAVNRRGTDNGIFRLARRRFYTQNIILVQRSSSNAQSENKANNFQRSGETTDNRIVKMAPIFSIAIN